MTVYRSLVVELGGVIDDTIFEGLGEILLRGRQFRLDRFGGGERVRTGALEHRHDDGRVAREVSVAVIIRRAKLDARDVRHADLPPVGIAADDDIGEILGIAQAALRSEEHTSELQSLMRISYADFCLKKKNTK